MSDPIDFLNKKEYVGQGALNSNSNKAESMTLAEWINMVRPYGAWDYKRIRNLDCLYGCENFGNYNYGMTGAAMGFSLEALQVAAGWVATVFGTSHPSWGNPWSGPPYGDDPKDQVWIKRGYDAYFRKNQ